MRDLGVIIDSDVKFHSHVNSAVSKANRILSLIRKSFVNLVYKTLVRPLLAYGYLIWGPFYILDQRLVENIQQRATCLVPSMRHLPYTDQLKKLDIPSLSY